jgi:hypothetical protein
MANDPFNKSKAYKQIGEVWVSFVAVSDVFELIRSISVTMAEKMLYFSTLRLTLLTIPFRAPRSTFSEPLMSLLMQKNFS